MSTPRCGNCGGTDWITESAAREDDEIGRCRDCREYPTLGYLVEALIRDVCAIPDGDHMGEPYIPTDEQFRFLLRHYRISPFTQKDPARDRWTTPFVYFRGSQLVRPQKWGKGPFASAIVCAEAHPEGPVVFDGWDADGQPVGRPWATPHIQITAVSEDQVANVYRALVPMIELGALKADIPDTGKTRINLPSGGLIEPVTASAVSRLGQRITCVVQDQTESWLKRNKGRDLADNQRRGLAGMGGRFIETPNAWDPAEQSVAQQTSEGGEVGVYLDDVEPAPGLSVRNKADRRKALKLVYGDSWWVDIDRIDGEIVSLLDRDPAQAERWFLNRKRAAEDAGFNPEAWQQRYSTFTPPRGSMIVVGIDGARFVDAISMIATHVESGHQWPLGIWERPESAPDDYEHPWSEVDGALAEAFSDFYVWRAYVDPQFIEDWLNTWRGRWGEKRVIPWMTNRPRQMAWAVRNYTEAVGGIDMDRAADMSHNGDAAFTRHIGNAKRQKVKVYDDKHRQMYVLSKESPDSARKIDSAPAAVLSWEARGDAIAAGAKPPRRGGAFL
jgi:hypothetical protein